MEDNNRNKKDNIDVGYISTLARIKLDNEFEKRLQSEMKVIVEYINQLRELDVSDIEPTAHAAPMTNIWRNDVSGEPFRREEMLSNAPETVNDELVKVQQVIGEEGES